jgi:hypothetical protein
MTRGDEADDVAPWELDPVKTEEVLALFGRSHWPQLASLAWLRYQETGLRYALVVAWPDVKRWAERVAEDGFQRGASKVQFIRGTALTRDDNPLAALLERCDPAREIVLLSNREGSAAIAALGEEDPQTGDRPVSVRGRWVGHVLAAAPEEGRLPPPEVVRARAH